MKITDSHVFSISMRPDVEEATAKRDAAVARFDAAMRAENYPVGDRLQKLYAPVHEANNALIRVIAEAAADMLATDLAAENDDESFYC